MKRQKKMKMCKINEYRYYAHMKDRYNLSAHHSHREMWIIF